MENFHQKGNPSTGITACAGNVCWKPTDPDHYRACGIAGEEFGGPLQVDLLQNAMLITGIVTLIQPVVCDRTGWQERYRSSWWNQFRIYQCVQQCSSGDGRRGVSCVWGKLMASASVIGGLFEVILVSAVKTACKFFPAVVTGTVVLSIEP